MNSKNDIEARLSDSKPGIDAEAIRALSDLLAETGLTEIEVEHNGARIRVARTGAPALMTSMPAVVQPVPPPPAPSAASPVAGPHAGAVASPMVGTVYVAAESGKPPFVKVGQQVNEGETLFIVEAMKTMNPIAAPKSGTVKEICVEDGAPVEFGQTLLILG